MFGSRRSDQGARPASAGGSVNTIHGRPGAPGEGIVIEIDAIPNGTSRVAGTSFVITRCDPGASRPVVSKARPTETTSAPDSIREPATDRGTAIGFALGTVSVGIMSATGVFNDGVYTLANFIYAGGAIVAGASIAGAIVGSFFTVARPAQPQPATTRAPESRRSAGQTDLVREDSAWRGSDLYFDSPGDIRDVARIEAAVTRDGTFASPAKTTSSPIAPAAEVVYRAVAFPETTVASPEPARAEVRQPPPAFQSLSASGSAPVTAAIPVSGPEEAVETRGEISRPVRGVARVEGRDSSASLVPKSKFSFRAAFETMRSAVRNFRFGFRDGFWRASDPDATGGFPELGPGKLNVNMMIAGLRLGKALSFLAEPLAYALRERKASRDGYRTPRDKALAVVSEVVGVSAGVEVAIILNQSASFGSLSSVLSGLVVSSLCLKLFGHLANNERKERKYYGN